MQAYIADLHEYNNGNLIGFWLDLEDKDAEDIRMEIQEFLDKRGHEEYAVHDWEEMPSYFGEYPDWEEVVEYVSGVQVHGAAFTVYWDHFYNCSLDDFQDRYSGSYDSSEDWAEQYLENTGEVPEYLQYYIDYERYARDAGLSGEMAFFETNGLVHVFYNH